VDPFLEETLHMGKPSLLDQRSDVLQVGSLDSEDKHPGEIFRLLAASGEDEQAGDE
jgi:hypothetical protein